jgi:hypothetical protein
MIILFYYFVDMDKVRLITEEDRLDWGTSVLVFRNEGNARAEFERRCWELKQDYADYTIEEYDDALYVDDVYIYLEIFSSWFEDDD